LPWPENEVVETGMQ